MSLHARLALTLSFATFASLTAHAAVETPPQFVLLAYDGSKSIKMWEDTRLFAKQVGAKFTYFINTPYFMKKSKASTYKEPQRGPGKICITWGDTITPNDDNERWRNEEIGQEQQFFQQDGGGDIILRRMELMNQAYLDGNEIAVHAVGHCNGEKFSTAQWNSEFQQFFKQLMNYVTVNGFKDVRQGYLPAFKREELVGFRAPELAMTRSQLFPALRQNGFRYDTSETASATKWPHKNAESGHWSFPLADIPIVGTGKMTLSMDYNFYVSQSGGKPVRDPNLIKAFEDQMYDSYMSYFWKNYQGNRAPIHIGHHFSRWNEGAYWKAFQRFANDVCNLPEVRCGTYTELANFVEANRDKLSTWETSKFKNSVRRPSSANDASFEMALGLNMGEKSFRADIGEIYARNDSVMPAAEGRQVASALNTANIRWNLDGIELVQARGKAELPKKDVEKLMSLSNRKQGLLQVAYYKNPDDLLSFQTRTVLVKKKGKSLDIGSSVLENAAQVYEGGEEFGLNPHE